LIIQPGVFRLIDIETRHVRFFYHVNGHAMFHRANIVRLGQKSCLATALVHVTLPIGTKRSVESHGQWVVNTEAQYFAEDVEKIDAVGGWLMNRINRPSGASNPESSN
jgi:hypothetical protein